jgi:diaminohydroxyphosphoribosylaminopyrimidine deaminase / 5-amino-6-(5-phosphoribosylamino)uracil reductase
LASSGPSATDLDRAYMRNALGLAARALGSVAPNPAVGCVLVAPGSPARIVGRGWTQAAGRPHAEAEALARAGVAAKGATAYVTLEPCNHVGRGPACADALAAAQIARAVVACEDPDPRTNGEGIAKLRARGVEVVVGCQRTEAEALNAGFFLRLREGRPLVTLKLATTLDGRIATRSGESRWITGELARAQVHLLRARHDAVMVGAMTAASDDPELYCRLPGLEGRQPLRIVFDTHLRLPLTSKLVQSAAQNPVWIVIGDSADRARADAFRDAGVQLLEIEPDATGYPPLRAVLAEFGRRGLTRILVEGGSHLAAALAASDMIDRIEWFRAPRLFGADAVPAAQAYGVERIVDARRFRRVAAVPQGDDLWESYERIG